MELKDVILSTLAELEDETLDEKINTTRETFQKNIQNSHPIQEVEEDESEQKLGDELVYLHSIRERLLVLFEGFQAPNNANIEAKIDMTLNFLEYTLATIDQRIQRLEKGELQ
jgi:hypothetical protein